MAIANQSFTSGYCASQSWLPTSCSAGRDFVTSQVRPMVKAHFFPASRFKQTSTGQDASFSIHRLIRDCCPSGRKSLERG